MTPTHVLILGAILVAAVQAQARHGSQVAADGVLPVHWLAEHFQPPSCTGVDLNIGCVPVEWTLAQEF